MKALVLFLLIVGSAVCKDDDDDDEPYNVLVINPDDMRPSLGCYGVNGPKTPNIDALAGRGVLFLNNFVQQPVCNPSRSSFMTGFRPDTTQVWNFINHFRQTTVGQSWVTMPGYFKQNGYFTAGAGKSFHDNLPPNYDGNKSWSIDQFPYLPVEKEQCYQIDDGNHTLIQSTVPPEAVNPDAVCPLDRSDDTFFEYKVTDHILNAMNYSIQSNQKFFLWAGFFKPHAPAIIPKRFYDMYIDNITLPSNKFLDVPLDFSDPALFNYAQGPQGQSPFTNGTHTLSYGPTTPFPDEWIKIMRAGYYGAISWTDSQIGRLLQGMEDLGVAHKTIVVLFSDNGIMMGENSAYIKTDNWDLSTRVPLIFAGPGIPHGKIRKTVVELLDVYPTLSHLAGLPVPTNLHGKDNTKVVRSSAEHQFSSYAAFSQTPRCGDYKSVRPWELLTTTIQWTCLGTGRAKFNYIGYTVRTKDWRFTEWRLWNSTALSANWNTTGYLGNELYDHRGVIPGGDNLFESEQHNIYNDYAGTSYVTTLRDLLYSNFDPSYV